MRVLCFVRRRPRLMAIGFAYGDGLSDRAEPIGCGEGCRPDTMCEVTSEV